ncbi:MAG: hypothetical protein NZ937_00870 [Armatimonadetes bacterium]|nr:hypothetical protein [Armatimonadota bacterium]
MAIFRSGGSLTFRKNSEGKPTGLPNFSVLIFGSSVAEPSDLRIGLCLSLLAFYGVRNGLLQNW